MILLCDQTSHCENERRVCGDAEVVETLQLGLRAG